MMGSDRFSLRWNNYQTHLVTAFESLLAKNEFVDVTLGCDGQKLSAHRMLLSACSPYFRNLLQDNHCEHPIIVLRDITYHDMSSLLQFMYNGEVNVEQSHLTSFLKTAECLKIRGLTDNEADNETIRPTNELPNLKNDGRKLSNTSPFSIPEKIQSKADRSAKKTRSDSYNTTETPRIPISSPNHRTIQTIDDIKNEVIDVADDGEQKTIFDYPDDLSNLPIAMEGEEDEYGESDLYEGGLNESGIMNGNLVAGSMTSNESHAAMDGYNEESGLYECRMCDKKFTHWNSARHHRVVHQGKTTCKLCNKVFSRMFELRKHMRRIHNEGTAGSVGPVVQPVSEFIRNSSNQPLPSLYHSVLFNN